MYFDTHTHTHTRCHARRHARARSRDGKSRGSTHSYRFVSVRIERVKYACRVIYLKARATSGAHERERSPAIIRGYVKGSPAASATNGSLYIKSTRTRGPTENQPRITGSNLFPPRVAAAFSRDAIVFSAAMPCERTPCGLSQLVSGIHGDLRGSK